MELKEGKHIRTKDGFLHTILGISEQTGRPYHTDKTDLGNYIELDNISKCVDRIMDLIEVGDYVNKLRVYGITDYGLQIYMFGDCPEILKEDEIKTIVTKEHFEGISYKVG